MQSAIYCAAKNKIFVSIRLKAYTNTLSKDKYSICGSMCLSHRSFVSEIHRQ